MPRHPFEWISESAQKRAFIVFALLALALFACLQLLGAPLKTPLSPQGIVSFELAGDLPAAQSMLAAWGASGQVYAGLNLGLDYLFIAAYALAIGLGCLLVARGLLPRLGGAAAALGVALAWGQIVAALFDSLENLALIRLLLGSDGAFWPALARWCAMPKFGLVFLGLLYLLLGAGLCAVVRPPRPMSKAA